MKKHIMEKLLAFSVLGAVILSNIADAAPKIGKITPEELKGHVFQTYKDVGDPASSSELKISRDGSWLMSGTLVSGNFHDRSTLAGNTITLADSDIPGLTGQLLCLQTKQVTLQIGGQISRPTPTQQAQIQKAIGKSMSFMLAFANAEGGEILLAE
ncbi:MAG: hypothetical protein A2603_14530 [Bdellovibrionales bacterium RIFOXYD1_FULL_55_31]|nr:MAG: hypothetical protein A2603_14530 [Bdellovibrionales bacterium RIFOXYD1_FULL_55_31]